MPFTAACRDNFEKLSRNCSYEGRCRLQGGTEAVPSTRWSTVPEPVRTKLSYNAWDMASTSFQKVSPNCIFSGIVTLNVTTNFSWYCNTKCYPKVQKNFSEFRWNFLILSFKIPKFKLVLSNFDTFSTITPERFRDSPKRKENFFFREIVEIFRETICKKILMKF